MKGFMLEKAFCKPVDFGLGSANFILLLYTM